MAHLSRCVCCDDNRGRAPRGPDHKTASTSCGQTQCSQPPGALHPLLPSSTMWQHRWRLSLGGWRLWYQALTRTCVTLVGTLLDTPEWFPPCSGESDDGHSPHQIHQAPVLCMTRGQPPSGVQAKEELGHASRFSGKCT